MEIGCLLLNWERILRFVGFEREQNRGRKNEEQKLKVGRRKNSDPVVKSFWHIRIAFGTILNRYLPNKFVSSIPTLELTKANLNAGILPMHPPLPPVFSFVLKINVGKREHVDKPITVNRIESTSWIR